MKKCIAFDIDRTMIDSYMPEILSLQEAIEIVTQKKISKKDLKRMTTLTTDEFFKTLNLDEKEVLLVKKEWSNTYSKYEIKCFPKIKEVIRELYNREYIIAIITSRTVEEFHELDDELKDILDCFNVIVCSDKIKKSKPNRESMDYLCSKLQINSRDIIYIGDSKTDSIFSKNCNIDFIPACWENKELEKEKMACFSPDQIIPIIENLE